MDCCLQQCYSCCHTSWFCICNKPRHQSGYITHTEQQLLVCQYCAKVYQKTFVMWWSWWLHSLLRKKFMGNFLKTTGYNFRISSKRYHSPDSRGGGSARSWSVLYGFHHHPWWGKTVLWNHVQFQEGSAQVDSCYLNSEMRRSTSPTWTGWLYWNLFPGVLRWSR